MMTGPTTVIQKGAIAAAIVATLVLGAASAGVPSEPGAIEGSISNDNGPVTGAVVEARDQRGITMRATSDYGGHYELKNLRPSSYSLRVEAPSRNSVWVPRIAVESGQTIQRNFHIKDAAAASGIARR